MPTKTAQDESVRLPDDPAASLSVPQAAALLGLRPPTIYKLVCIRMIPHYKVGKTI